MTEKCCTTCNKSKPADQFFKRAEKPHLLLFGCKERRLKYSVRKKKQDPAKYKAYALKQYHKQPKSKIKDRNLRTNHGISLEHYNQLHTAQQGLCKICNQPETLVINGVQRDLAVDHCHKTGTIRGLLCGACNRAIGLLKDDTTLLNNAIQYLKTGS